MNVMGLLQPLSHRTTRGQKLPILGNTPSSRAWYILVLLVQCGTLVEYQPSLNRSGHSLSNDGREQSGGFSRTTQSGLAQAGAQQDQVHPGE